jgi:hypothetical protein
MFGRRRHVAPVVAAPAPQLTEERIFDVVHAQIAAAIGGRGEWALTRRADADTDEIFHGVIAHSVATHVIEALRAAREQLTEGDGADATDGTDARQSGDHVAEETPDHAHEPAAFGWQPAPITVWTDLKKPVTGPIAGIGDHGVRDHELVA